MQQPHYFNTVNTPGIAEYKDKGSRFIAKAIPVETIADCKQKLADIKKEFPKASHYCFAYRLGLDKNQFRVNDDGEPSGTAGRPILSQIDSREVTNILIVVIRYFGGTLLGIPGLMNAYKSAASMVLQVTPLVRRPVLILYRLQFDYTQMNNVMTIVKQFDCEILKQDLQLFCILDIGIPQLRLNEVIIQLGDMRGIAIKEL